MTTQTQDKQEAVDLQQLAIWTVVAAVVSSIIIVILFQITKGQFEGALQNGAPFDNTIFVIAILVQVGVGGILLGILDRFLDRPITTWMWVAIVVLVLTLAMPFAFIEWADGVEPNLTAQIILVVMHLITGAITIYLLTTRTAK